MPRSPITRKAISQLRRAVRKAGYRCTVITIGTGKRVELGLCGAHAEVVAQALQAKGYERTPMSGDGVVNPITFG